MPKRNCSFNGQLKEDFSFLFAKDGTQTVWCAICKNSFSNSHGGRADLNDHIQTKKHKTSQAASSSSYSVTSFFSKTEPTHNDIKLAAAEGVFTHRTVKHNHSSALWIAQQNWSKSCSIKSFLLHALKQKRLHLTCWRLYIAINEMKSHIEQAKLITVVLDTSNHNPVKLAPVLLRYFLPSLGMKTIILDFQSSIKGETSDILAEYIMSALQAHHLQLKLLGFVADNSNTNFGGAERRGEKNIF